MRRPIALFAIYATIHGHIKQTISFLGRLARRDRWFPCSRRRRSNQPEWSDGACRVSCDGVDRVILYRPIGLCFAANRDCSITRHSAGIVPALLDHSETPTGRLRYMARMAAQTTLSRGDLFEARFADQWPPPARLAVWNAAIGIASHCNSGDSPVLMRGTTGIRDE